MTLDTNNNISEDTHRKLTRRSSIEVPMSPSKAMEQDNKYQSTANEQEIKAGETSGGAGRSLATAAGEPRSRGADLLSS